MRLLGKTLVVLIFLASIVFMTISAIVYATHRDLKAVAQERQTEAREASDRFDAAKEQYNRVGALLRRQVEAQLQQLRKLESERLRLADRDAALRQQLEALVDAHRNATREIAEAQRRNLQIVEENEEIRNDVAANQQVVAEAVRRVVVAVEAVNQLQGELEVLAERNADLKLQNTQYTSTQ